MVDALLHADLWLRALAVTHRWPPLDGVMLALTTVGRAGAIWFALAAIGWYRRRSHGPAFWQAITAILLALIVSNLILKPAVHRERPFAASREAAVIGAEPRDYSFPSGHAAASFAGALAIGHVWPGAAAALWALAVLISYSRIYVGVHYPIDVVGGALVGIAAAYFAVGRTRWRGAAPAVGR